MTIEPLAETYEVGDNLVCSADGNPRPTFQWTDSRTNRVIGGPVLTIDMAIPLMKIITFKCTATNVVAGESKRIFDNVTFMVVTG